MFIKNLLRDCPEFIAGDDTRLRELVNPLHAANFPARYSLAHAIVEPGKQSTPHKMLTSECYYILSGKGTMHIDKETAEVGTGDLVSIPPGATQWIKNSETDPLVFLAIVDPAWRKEDEVII